ncbi:4a-hydroxytetrahydrobiopterin dehydratase [beta proteobacterium MWH-UniP1]
MPSLLSADERQKSLLSLPHWSYRPERGGLITREYRFADFLQAFAFMQEMADFSESIGHHPEWTNVYQRISVTLTTHDAGGLTELDVAWAAQADAVASKIQGQGNAASTLAAPR